MPFIKLLLSVAILSLGISGAVYIAKNPDLPSQNAENSNDSPMAFSEKNNNQVRGRPFVEPLTLQSLELPFTTGLTADLSKNIAELLIENNPNGPQNIDGKSKIIAPDPQTIAEQLFRGANEKFDLANLTPVITDNQIVISPENTPEALAAYLNRFRKIFTDGAAQQPQNPSEDYLPETIKAYQNVIQNFYNLSVPKSAAEFHKKLIALLEAKKNIFEKLFNDQKQSSDPVLIIAAANAREQIDLGFADLLKNFSIFLQESGF